MDLGRAISFSRLLKRLAAFSLACARHRPQRKPVANIGGRQFAAEVLISMRDVQYGFTGQNVLTAFNLLRSEVADDRRLKALRVIEFFVSTARASTLGFTPGLYNFDTGRFGG